ncbi:MAG: hypothetical protein WCP30_10800, partial [Mycobacteriaceae bacterium]
MPIADLPPGEWTPLLIGDQWPSYSSLEAISAGASSRQILSSAFEDYSDLLLDIKHRNLDPQEGITAEDASGAFARGGTHSGQIAQSNAVKRGVYTTVHDKVVELRTGLRKLAAKGNDRINDVNRSERPLPDKIVEILEIVTTTREEAFVQTAGCAGYISDQIRMVLGAQGIDTSAQEFAAVRGVDPTKRVPTNTGELEAEIGRKLDQLNGTGSTGLPVSAATGTSKPPLGDQGVQAYT